MVNQGARLSRLLTFVEVADLLGETGPRRGRKVRRWIERQSWAAEVLVFWSGTRGAYHRSRQHYRVSLAALREHAPQLRPRRDEALDAAREAVAELEEEVEQTREQLEALARETGQRLRAADQRIAALAARPAQGSLPFAQPQQPPQVPGQRAGTPASSPSKAAVAARPGASQGSGGRR